MSFSPIEFTLDFAIQSYWHIGSGLEGGAYADALVLKSADDLPYIPGKSIKGLLKEAFMQANDNHWFAASSCPDLVSLLFGTEGQAGDKTQGILQISSGTLSAAECEFFAQNPSAKINLFKVSYATAIDEETGVAKETSFRSLEVVVPMCLSASISLNTRHPEYTKSDNSIGEHMALWLSQVSTLITKLGAKRHRGLGQVRVTIKESQNTIAGGV